MIALTEEQRTIYRIAEQKLQEDAPWDYEALGDAFRNLLSFDPSTDLDLTGFSIAEIDAHLGLLDEEKRIAFKKSSTAACPERLKEH